MYPAISGEALASSDHDAQEYASYAAGKIPLPPGPSSCSGDAAAPAPHAMYPTSTMRMRIRAIWRRLMWVALLRASWRSFGCWRLDLPRGRADRLDVPSREPRFRLQPRVYAGHLAG